MLLWHPHLDVILDVIIVSKRRQQAFASKAAWDDVTEKKIMGYIVSNLQGRQALNIRWFGGEPLLVFPSVQRVQNELRAICKEADIGFSSFIQTKWILI